MSRRNATANRCCTWQSVAEEIKGLPDQLATRSEALQKRLAPTITQSIIVKIEGLREFDSVALFGLCDALSGWSTGCTASVLSDLSLTVQDAINARNDAEATGQRRVDANKKTRFSSYLTRLTFASRSPRLTALPTHTPPQQLRWSSSRDELVRSASKPRRKTHGVGGSPSTWRGSMNALVHFRHTIPSTTTLCNSSAWSKPVVSRHHQA